MITINTKLDMRHGAVPPVVHLSQYDSDFTLTFDLYASDGAFTVQSGTTAAIRGTKTDGEPFSMDAAISGTTVTVTGTHDQMQQLTAAFGNNVFELTLYHSGKELNTANFIVFCERAAMDKDTMGGQSVIRELVSVIDRTDEIIAAARQADTARDDIAALTTRAETAATSAESSQASAAQSAQSAASTLASAEAVIAQEQADAIDAIDDAYQAHIDEINQKAAQIAQAKTNAEEIATQALQAAGNADATSAETANQLDAIGKRVDNVQLAAENYVDDGYVENGVAYFTHNGAVLFEITGIGGGGGGGGGGGDTVKATLTVTNTSGWLSKTIASGGTCPISLVWSSIEDDMPTGNGTLRITNNGAFRASLEIAQGNVTVDLSQYLTTGSNVVKVQVADVYGQSRTINFSVTVVALSISSSFDTSAPFTGAILFPYTPVGAVAKTVHFILDGTQVATYETSVSNRQLTQTFPAQSHGGHTLRVYFTAEINGEAVQSNELYFEFISVEDFNDNVIIVSPYNATTVAQYSSIVIPYTVYDPNNLTAEVKIYANNELISTQTVDRTQQSYTYRANNYGALALKLKSGTAEKVISLTVTESDIDVEAETENLALFLSSSGRSNNEEHPETWTFNNISASLTGFNFTSDGWQTDKDGITVLRVSGDARVTIPYKPFATDFRTTGKTIELEFATRDVLNYDATILSCMSGDRGISVTAQKALLKSEQSEISTQYKEDEHVRIAFVCEKRAENRLLLIYINGIASGVVQYPNDDDFAQANPVNISIGSSSCTCDLYCIRVYDNDLNRFQVLDNWIADTQDGALMLERFTRNNVFDAYGNIVISQLPATLPYMIRTAEELPQYKGDKKTISISYVNPQAPAKSFTATGVQSDVQGTSSQYYPRKNYKDKYKNGFTLSSGTTANKYAMNTEAVPTNTFTMKADVASSEGANNVELARLYNEACPYKTPAQNANSKVRQGIDGFPIVMFWNDGESTTFLGKYNFNNDKGTAEVFGFADPDESWEVLNNTSDRVLWKSDDYSGSGWLNDFEARYPDADPAYTDPSQLAEFAEWVKSTDREQATGAALPASFTYNGVTYTSDTAAYRLAKFKAEAGDYMEMQSALFYYLFTELFLMVDSRAKNAFPSFMGTEVSE